MSGYIDRETAIDEIDKWLDSVGYVTVGKGLSSYGELVGCLEDTPAADVVEVVRCKDCRFWTKQNDSLQGRCLLSENYPTREWYCANGERKDGE